MSTVFDRLPAALRPLESEPAGGARRRSAELAVLLVVGVLLAIATVHDLANQVQIDKRLGADKTTWRAYTHRAVKIGLQQGIGTDTDVGCAPPVAGAPYRLCLVMSGPARGGLRTVTGGYRLALVGADSRRHRSACFGLALRQGACPPSA